MKMDLKSYNQKLLAIIGTMIIAAVGVGLMSALIAFIASLIPRDIQRRDSGIVIDQNQVVDTLTTSFKQEISILEPYQLDSLEPVFLVPIGQKDQEMKRTKVLSAGMSFSSYETTDNYYYSSFTGLYNNFVLIDYSRNKKLALFDTKIALTEWAYLKIDSSQLILFRGTDTDTNEDGLLNDDDFQSLFVYDVGKLKTKELRFRNETVLSFEPLALTSKIYVRTGKDSNQNLEFEYSREPTDLYIYDVRTGEEETLIPSEIKQKIQDILNK